MLVIAPTFSGFAAIVGSAAAAPGFGRERWTLSTGGRGHGLSDCPWGNDCGHVQRQLSKDK